jgi:hypothetical protein
MNEPRICIGRLTMSHKITVKKVHSDWIGYIFAPLDTFDRVQIDPKLTMYVRLGFTRDYSTYNEDEFINDSN